MGHVEQIADHLDRDRGGKIADQLDVAFRGDRIEQPVHQRDQIRLHLRDRARRQRAHDQPPHPCMRGRIVEDETGGVVLVEQRIAVFREKLLLLVG